MTSDNSAAKARETRETQPPDQNLDHHYRAIGISAVAAAVNYCRGAARTDHRKEHRDPAAEFAARRSERAA